MVENIESLEDFFYAFEDAMSSPEYVALSLFTNVLNFVASIVNLALSVFLINVFTIGGCTFFLSCILLLLLCLAAVLDCL